MRIAILSTIFASAAAVGACSSGGPGSLELSPLDLGREPGADGTFFSPYEAPPNAGATIVTGQDPAGTTGGSSKKDGGGGVTSTGGIDSGISLPIDTFDAGTVKKDASITTVDAGGTCADLEPCCATLSTSLQTGCNSVVTNGNDAACGSALNSYKGAGFCG